MNKNLLFKIKVSFASAILKGLYSTNKIFVKGRKNYKSLLNNNKPAILSIWHSQLLSIVYDLRKLPINAIAGTHRDAHLISSVATKWGWNMIRGSSKEKGEVAYKAMVSSLKKGELVFITPDGPTGPPRIPKPGIIRASQFTGAGIIPVSVHSTLRWGFTNWDTFYLEKPFGKIFIEYGKPIYFNKNSQIDTCSQRLIKEMNNVEFSNLHYTNNEQK